MNSIEDKLASDKCCCCIPIVPGMKILTFVMIVSCIAQVVGLVGAMNQGIGSFLGLLSIVDIVFCLVIICYLGMWFKENTIKSRADLVYGLWVNIW